MPKVLLLHLFLFAARGVRSQKDIVNCQLPCYNGLGLRAISSVGERFVHTEEVAGSIPASPSIFLFPHFHLKIVPVKVLLRAIFVHALFKYHETLPPKSTFPMPLRANRSRANAYLLYHGWQNKCCRFVSKW